MSDATNQLIRRLRRFGVDAVETEPGLFALQAGVDEMRLTHYGGGQWQLDMTHEGSAAAPIGWTAQRRFQSRSTSSIVSTVLDFVFKHSPHL